MEHPAVFAHPAIVCNLLGRAAMQVMVGRFPSVVGAASSSVDAGVVPGPRSLDYE
jgi:hypothetical protein